ncbi:MAG: hypothetical protein V7640_3411, partial [Betaproteobacteria bacterium]
VPALAFDDPGAARENLDLLKVRPSILAAAIYDDKGHLFASYRREGASGAVIPQSPAQAGSRVLSGKNIAIFHRIVENNREQGTVYIQARYELTKRLLDYLGILTIVTVLSMIAALLMSAWLQRAMTNPITDITDTAHQVMDTRDFSLRVRKTTEDEIGYLVDAFNNMLAEIGRRSEALLNADRMKDQFLAMLAHELRNPLAPISNALHLLEVSGNRPDVAANARAMMSRQLKQLVRLVDDLLDVSRITTGKLVLHKETLELRKVIDNAVEIARPVIESRGHDLHVHLPPNPVYLDADETRLSQVFSNLLNNAAKYTDTGGRIDVRATLHGSDIEVAVVDNGVGIAPDVLPDLFNMFTQGSTAIERTQAGLGVGLALAQHLTKMHGGVIHGYSGGLGQGSRFTVRLPVARDPVETVRSPTIVDTVGANGHRILVVDDNQDFATSLAMILTDMGHEVQVEHDGLAGLRAAESFQPALAFLDIGMPGLDGYELARRLRAGSLNLWTMLVAVTGWGQDADRARAREAGFDYHIVKPLDPSQLPAILSAATHKQEMRDALPDRA